MASGLLTEQHHAIDDCSVHWRDALIYLFCISQKLSTGKGETKWILTVGWTTPLITESLERLSIQSHSAPVSRLTEKLRRPPIKRLAAKEKMHLETWVGCEERSKAFWVGEASPPTQRWKNASPSNHSPPTAPALISPSLSSLLTCTQTLRCLCLLCLSPRLSSAPTKTLSVSRQMKVASHKKNAAL